MARGDQLTRQWKIIQALIASKSGRSVTRLAREFDCHLRTVYRDLEALQAAGFPLYTYREAGRNLWALMDTVRRPVPLPLDLTEVVALYLSRDLLASPRQGVIQQALASLFAKLKATLSPDYLKAIEKIGETYAVGPVPYKPKGQDQGVIDALNRAMVDQRNVEIVYYAASRRQETRRKVAPYKIWFFNGTFYLIGHCLLRQDVRIFALDRIRDIRITTEGFDADAAINVDRYMQASFGVFAGPAQRVRIRFDPPAADYIRETVWHPSQRLEPGPKDSLLLEMDVALSRELVGWVLQWGAAAHVCDPPALKEEIRCEARAIAAGHSCPPE